MLTTKSNNKFTVVSIEKYEDYQVDKRELKQQTNNKRTTNEQQTNTNNNNKNVNNIKNIYRDFSDDLKKALDDFVEMRNKIKKPLTEKALNLAINKLRELSNNEQTQIEIINESVLHSWQTFYPLKEERKTNMNNYQQREYTDLDKLYANGR